MALTLSKEGFFGIGKHAAKLPSPSAVTDIRETAQDQVNRDLHDFVQSGLTYPETPPPASFLGLPLRDFPIGVLPTEPVKFTDEQREQDSFLTAEPFAQHPDEIALAFSNVLAPTFGGELPSTPLTQPTREIEEQLTPAPFSAVATELEDSASYENIFLTPDGIQLFTAGSDDETIFLTPSYYYSNLTGRTVEQINLTPVHDGFQVDVFGQHYTLSIFLDSNGRVTISENEGEFSLVEDENTKKDTAKIARLAKQFLASSMKPSDFNWEKFDEVSVLYEICRDSYVAHRRESAESDLSRYRYAA